MKAYILGYSLIATLPSFPTEDVYQAIDETGVRLGAYFGCYTESDNSLTCILPDKPEKEDNKENA